MIGRLRHRLTLQRPVLTADGAGGQNRSWEEAAKVWADLRDISGAQAGFAEGLAATTRTRITIRWRADLTAVMRFSDGQRIFNIISVLDQTGVKRFLTCICEEDLREREAGAQ